MSTTAGAVGIAPPAPAPVLPPHSLPKADPRQVRARAEQAMILARQLMTCTWTLTAELDTQRQLLARQLHSAQQHLHQRQHLLQHRSGRETDQPAIDRGRPAGS